MRRLSENKTGDAEITASGTQSHLEESSRPRHTRRALLAAISGVGIAGATRLPSQWSRPVVDHVLLPAHAAGSPFTITACSLYCTEVASYAITTSPSGGGVTIFTLHITEGVICGRVPNGDTTADTNTTSEVYPSSTTTDPAFFTYFTASAGLITSASSSGTIAPSNCQLPSYQPFPLD